MSRCEALQAFGLQMRVQTWEYTARIALINFEALLVVQDARRLDVKLGIVKVMACFGVDTADSANHF